MADKRKRRRPTRTRGHFELVIPKGARVTGFDGWAKDQNDTDFRMIHRDPRRRAPEREKPEPDERRRT